MNDTSHPLTLIYGEESFLSRKAISAVRTTFLARETDLNLTEKEGGNITVKELLALLPPYPFLGERRLVIVTDTPAKLMSAFAEAAPAIPDFLNLVFQTYKVDKRTSGFLYFKKNAHLIPCESVDARDMPDYVQQIAGEKKLDLAPSAARLLASFVGTSLSRLVSEITKLKLYKGDARATEEDVRLLVTPSDDTDPFALGEKMLPGRASDMLAALTSEISSGRSLFAVVPLLASRTRTLLSLSSALSTGMKESDIGSHLGIHPFVVKKSLSTARAFQPDALAAFLISLQQLESDLKNGRFAGDPEEIALTLLHKNIVTLLAR